MALSQIIRQVCPSCGKVAVELTRVKLGSSSLITLQCGHMATEGSLGSADEVYEQIESSDGRKLMKYQIEGVKFLEAANARAILADMQGLGKTVQVCSLLKLHSKTLLKGVVVSPATIKEQWHHEIQRWCGLNGFRTQVIKSGKEFAAPGFDLYIITYDLLKNEKMFDYVGDDIKSVFIDECQNIKNHLSDRAKAVQRLCKNKNVEHIIPMSGTPIKNNAGEYFTVLNLVKPRLFPEYTKFIRDDCDSYENGWGFKVGGLKNPDDFAAKTKDFIIRRTKEGVLSDLPKFARRFQHVELDGKVKKVYQSLISELEDVLYDDKMDAMQSGAAKIAIMGKMRHIVGDSKVEVCSDSVLDFVDSCERKIVVFTHHDTVRNRLEADINQGLVERNLGSCLVLHAGLSSDGRAALITRFREDPLARVMIASTKVAGVGLNLQFCSDAIMLERQWNPADEEQAEDRFHRFGQTMPVNVNYMICSETIDEYFTELVESKRRIVAAAMDNREIAWDESSLMSELAQVLVTRGKKAWSL